MIGLILLVLGGLSIAGAAVMLLLSDDTPTYLVVLALFAGITLPIGGLVLKINEEADACHARGGHMVDCGAPYYIKSGNTFVPIQPQRCEVQP